MTILQIKNNELKLIKNKIEETHLVRKVFGNLFKLTIPFIQKEILQLLSGLGKLEFKCDKK